MDLWQAILQLNFLPQLLLNPCSYLYDTICSPYERNPSFSSALVWQAASMKEISDLPFDLHHGQQLRPTLNSNPVA
ncbi:MAG: hypothetical protein Q7J80_08995 [Anaerolineales bacterium]|nr:hypothetical protein [Anaerolineales bacterium]